MISMDISNTPIANINEDGSIDVLLHVHFECTCCSDCCKLNNIPATEQDILDMMEHGIEIDQAIEVLSPVLIASKSIENGLIKAYILRKKPFVNECAFLDEKGMCKVHEFKPLACQLYPFSIRRRNGGYHVIIHPKCVCNFIEIDVEEDKSNTLQIVSDLMSALSIDDGNK
ncbi:MAG: YkgJ family cysteine cluster protein [Candidatus Heimdallarchaeota archaeon]|nr:YkgJ family cysteine cluster protein [Candidatus Heimdallarchaeota archaeon]MCK4878358.1 YkgJ family cysteine cluster protein [Candidatus Heimdallarchaeota archaeon]